MDGMVIPEFWRVSVLGFAGGLAMALSFDSLWLASLACFPWAVGCVVLDEACFKGMRR